MFSHRDHREGDVRVDVAFTDSTLDLQGLRPAFEDSLPELEAACGVRFARMNQVHGDTVLVDSKVICAYLEETRPQPPLLPKDPAQRARARFLELKSDTDVDAAVVVLATLKLFRPELPAQVPEA
ncbi:MAG: glutathione S-transferase family protein, partial [Nocardioides sp.]